jgi:hypothetical protein
MTVRELIAWLKTLPPDLPVAYPTDSGHIIATVGDVREVYVDHAEGWVKAAVLD